MSGQKRPPPKKRGLLGGLLCCISPHVEEPQISQQPSSASAIHVHQQGTHAQGSSTQQSISNGAETDMMRTDEYGDENNKRRNVQNNVENISAATPAPLVGTLIAASNQPIPGLETAPPLARREDGTNDTPVSSTSNIPGQDLPEDVAALMDDEPLTPSSAAITATVPVAAVVDEPTQMVTFGENNSWLLPPLSSNLRGRKCLVLDLDETLVHSSFKVRAMSFQATWIVLTYLAHTSS